MNKSGLRRLLEVESKVLVQAGSTANSEKIAQGFVFSNV